MNECIQLKSEGVKLYFNCAFYLMRMTYTEQYSGQGLPSIIACGVSDRPPSVTA